MPVFLLSAAMLAFSSVASASDCIALASDRDSLSEDDRRSALIILEDALTAAGVDVAAAPCSNTWTVSHVKLGGAVTVRLTLGSNSQQLGVSGLEELPVAYERLIRAIQTGQPVTETSDRSSVTAAEANPNRVQADPLIYVQLGGGITGLERIEGGTAFGLGYRHALDNVALDISALNLVMPADLEQSEQFAMTVVELSVLYYTDGDAARSPYLGGGLGYGLGTSDQGEGIGSLESKAGLQVQASVGYELLRQSSIRFFPQIDVTMPLYLVGEQRIPSASLTLNVAFRPPQNSSSSIIRF